jgi:hypothetical protein
LQEGLDDTPDVLSGQGTTLDLGAYMLGCSRLYPRAGKTAMRRAIEPLLRGAKANGIPAVFSTGGSGHDLSVEGTLQIVDDIARDCGLRLRIAVIRSEVDKEYLLEKIASGTRLKALIEHPSLDPYVTAEAVRASEHIVASAGPEPFVHALGLGVDAVISGRAVDESVHAALPLKAGLDQGLAMHAAKLVEVPLATETYGIPLMVTLRDGDFLIRPAGRNGRCTPSSVAAMALYERESPFTFVYPGGTLDLTRAQYEQHDDRTVRVHGAKWFAQAYTTKLEGARLAGFRSLGIGGIRDPQFIREFESIVEWIRQNAPGRYEDCQEGRDYRLHFRVFGKNEVMGAAEPIQESQGHELGLIVDVVARSQDLSRALCHFAMHRLMHASFPGQKTTAGNMAWSFSPEVVEAGEAYEFSIHHLLPLDDPLEPFKIDVIEFPRMSIR